MANQQDYFTPADARAWVQKGAPRPGRPFELLGCGNAMESTTNDGEPAPVICQNPRRRGQWDIIGEKGQPPALHDGGIRVYMPPATLSFVERMRRARCGFSVQVLVGKCEPADEFNAWQSKQLYEGATFVTTGKPALPSVTGENNDEVYVEGPFKYQYDDRILRMRFQEKAGAEVIAEVIDGVFCGGIECGVCAPYSEGCENLYVITRADAGSPGLSGQLVYTNDGETFTPVDIPTLGGLDPSRITCIGDFLVVISEAAGNLQYVAKHRTILTTDWVGVTAGFVALHGPRAIYAKSPTEVFVVGAGGYIYFGDDYQNGVAVIEDANLTSEDFNDIDGDGGNTIVAVAGNNVIVHSANSGETWGLLLGPQAGADLQAIAVMDEYNWVVGGDAGAFYYTNDSGDTWHAINFVGAGAGAIVHDIKFSPQTFTVGYAAIEIGSVGYVYRTTDGGNRWYRDEPSIAGLGANDRIRFVAPCPDNINVVAAGGLADGSSDGYLAIAE
jgi:hypothetical protein